MAKVKGLEELRQYIKKQADKAARKAQKQADSKTRQKLKEVSDEAIDKWYGGYDPTRYDRNEKRMKGYTIDIDGDGFYVDFDQQIATHQNNDLVSEIVISLGYHGGSPGDGVSGIHWRTGYNFNQWGSPATWDYSIINTINDEIDKINRENEDSAVQLFEKYFGAGW